VAGCGGTLKEGRREGTPDFRAAKVEYDRGNYLDAIPDFKAYVEQYPGTDLTDDALYYLGRCYLQEKEYALAPPSSTGCSGTSRPHPSGRRIVRAGAV